MKAELGLDLKRAAKKPLVPAPVEMVRGMSNCLIQGWKDILMATGPAGLSQGSIIQTAKGAYSC